MVQPEEGTEEARKESASGREGSTVSDVETELFIGLSAGRRSGGPIPMHTFV